MKIARLEKIAVVTGGGSGIGLAITEKFVSSGILTIIIGRNEQKLLKAKENLGTSVFPFL